MGVVLLLQDFFFPSPMKANKQQMYERQAKIQKTRKNFKKKDGMGGRERARGRGGK